MTEYKNKHNKVLGTLNKILKNNNYNDWNIELSIDTECDNELKIIRFSKGLIDNEPFYYIYEIFIHEVAHIDQDQNLTSSEAHDKDFYSRYGELLYKNSFIIDYFNKKRMDEQ